MTDETTHFFAATKLTREHAGGGTDSENITVHHIPLASIDTWLTEQQNAGLLIDFKIHACICLAQQKGLLPS